MVDFDQLGEHKNAFDGYDVGFCCLGTTKAKSGASGFVKVDRDYVYESAQFAKEGGCKQFHLLTAQNANKDSWFLYPRTKGEVEEKVTQLGFEKLFIYRPGLLLCDRQVIISQMFTNVYRLTLILTLGKKNSRENNSSGRRFDRPMG